MNVCLFISQCVLFKFRLFLRAQKLRFQNDALAEKYIEMIWEVCQSIMSIQK